MAKKQTFSGKVIEALKNSGVTRYQIAKQTGINKSSLSRMVNGDGWLGRPYLDRLADALGLDVVIRKSKGR